MKSSRNMTGFSRHIVVFSILSNQVIVVSQERASQSDCRGKRKKERFTFTFKWLMFGIYLVYGVIHHSMSMLSEAKSHNHFKGCKSSWFMWLLVYPYTLDYICFYCGKTEQLKLCTYITKIAHIWCRSFISGSHFLDHLKKERQVFTQT